MKKFTKIALIVASFALVAALAVGGTVAWLQASTNVVTNTFTPSDIELSLDETTPEKFTAQIIPGVDIAKDPNVTASADVDYYVFVKITETNWNENLTYTVATGWTPLTEGVTLGTGEKLYYKALTANTSLTDEPIIAGNIVYVDDDMLVTEMPKTGSEPQLSFMAYAIQQANGNGTIFTPADAWARVKDMATNSYAPGTTTTDENA